jgi:hypothetical protein
MYQSRYILRVPSQKYVENLIYTKSPPPLPPSNTYSNCTEYCLSVTVHVYRIFGGLADYGNVTLLKKTSKLDTTVKQSTGKSLNFILFYGSLKKI